MLWNMKCLGNQRFETDTVASVGIRVRSVCFCEKWDHTKWANTTTCASHWRIKDKTRGSRLPRSPESAPLSAFNLSPLSCAPFFLNFFSPLCLPVYKGAPRSVWNSPSHLQDSLPFGFLCFNLYINKLTYLWHVDHPIIQEFQPQRHPSLYPSHPMCLHPHCQGARFWNEK